MCRFVGNGRVNGADMAIMSLQIALGALSVKGPKL
jgi:hypothetical protein